MNSLAAPQQRRRQTSLSPGDRSRGSSGRIRGRNDSLSPNSSRRNSKSGSMYRKSSSGNLDRTNVRRRMSSSNSRTPSKEIRFPAINEIGAGRKRRPSMKGGPPRKLNRDRSRSTLPARKGSDKRGGGVEKVSDRELESLRRKIALQEKREDELLKKPKSALKSTGLDFGKFKKIRWDIFKRTMDDFVRLHPKQSVFLKEYRSEMERTFEHLKIKIKKSKEASERVQRQLKKREREFLLEIDGLNDRQKESETKEIELDLLIKSLHRQIKILHRQVKEQKNKNRAILEMMSKIRTEDPISVCVELINENEKQVTREKSLQQTINTLEKKQRRLRNKVSVQRLESLQSSLKEEKVKSNTLEKESKKNEKKVKDLRIKIRRLKTQEKSSTPRPDWKEYENNSSIQEVLIREGHIKTNSDEKADQLDDDDDDEENEKGTTRSMIRSIIWNHLKLEKQYVLLSSLGKGGSGPGMGTSSPSHRYFRSRGNRGGRGGPPATQQQYQTPKKSIYNYPTKFSGPSNLSPSMGGPGRERRSSSKSKGQGGQGGRLGQSQQQTRGDDDQQAQGSGETMQILDYLDELGDNMVKRWECLRHRKWINGYDNAHIPRRFHVNAKIRRIFISCDTAKFIVRQYWDMKLQTENGGRSIELRKDPVEFLQTFLKKKYGTSTSSKLNRRVVSEWAYSLHTALSMMKDIDPDCDLFRMIIYGGLSQDVYYACHWDIEKLRNTFRKIAEQSEHLSGKISLITLQRTLESFFPLKDERMISMLTYAVESDCGMNLKYVNYKRLFRIMDERVLEPTAFVMTLKSQFLHQRKELMNEIEENLISHSDMDNDGKVSVQQFCDTLVVVDPAIPVKVLDSVVMKCFGVKTLDELLPTFAGNRRKYQTIAVEEDIAMVMKRLKCEDFKRYTHDNKTLQYLKLASGTKKMKN